MVTTRLVEKELEGQAVGQMFAGLTLVLGVPGGVCGWNATFLLSYAIFTVIASQGRDKVTSIRGQLRVFADHNLLASLLFTVLV